MCRERALSDPQHKELWLTQAETHAQQALEHIAFQFRKEIRTT